MILSATESDRERVDSFRFPQKICPMTSVHGLLLAVEEVVHFIPLFVINCFTLLYFFCITCTFKGPIFVFDCQTWLSAMPHGSTILNLHPTYQKTVSLTFLSSPRKQSANQRTGSQKTTLDRDISRGYVIIRVKRENKSYCFVLKLI